MVGQEDGGARAFEAIYNRDFRWACPASLHFSSDLIPTVDTALLEKVQKYRAEPYQANVLTKQKL